MNRRWRKRRATHLRLKRHQLLHLKARYHQDPAQAHHQAKFVVNRIIFLQFIGGIQASFVRSNFIIRLLNIRCFRRKAPPRHRMLSQGQVLPVCPVHHLPSATDSSSSAATSSVSSSEVLFSSSSLRTDIGSRFVKFFFLIGGYDLIWQTLYPPPPREL